MSHTPAPWNIRFIREDMPERGFFIEAANNNKPDHPYGIEIMMDDFGTHTGYPYQQRLADAKLIAAAPEMLEALQEMLKLIQSKGVTIPAMVSTAPIGKAREAIQKATQ